MLELVFLAAGAALILGTRTAQVVLAYVVIVALATIVIAPVALDSALSLGLFVASSILKLIAAPIGIWFFLRSNPAARDLRPSIGMPARLLVVIGFAVVAQSLTQVPSLAHIPKIGIVAYVVLCALGMLVIHRNLLAHLIGLLALSAGIGLAASVFAPQLPELFELGASFDALVATFIGLALVRAFVVHNPLLDVESLRRLHG
jgi:hypothetical protein